MSRTITFQEAGSHARGSVRMGGTDYPTGKASAYALYTAEWAAVGIGADVNETATACAGGQLACPCGVTL